MKTKTIATGAFTILLLLSACGKDVLLTPEQGTMKVLLTDSAYPIGNVVSAKVTVSKIEVKSDSSSGDSFTEVNLPQPKTIDLINLRNGLTQDLNEAKVPTGTYSEIRLIANDGQIVLKDGQDYSLKVPSGEESGIKIKINPPVIISRDKTTEMLIDFDLSKSFVQQGNGKFLFKPVIRAASIPASGSISGTVTNNNGTPANTADDLPVSNAVVSVVSGDQVISTTTFSNDTGQYSVIGLPPGTYTVTISLPSFSDQTNQVVVNAGSATSLSAQLSPVNPL